VDALPISKPPWRLKGRVATTMGKSIMHHVSVLSTAMPPSLRVFLTRRTRVARISISTPKMFRASDCGRLGRQAADHPWSTLRVVKATEKTAQRLRGAARSRNSSSTPKRYQSSLSKLSTKGGGRGGEKKGRQSDWPANQIDSKVIDRQVEDR
jgi:hypothetical protein